MKEPAQEEQGNIIIDENFEEVQAPENNEEISINYVSSRKIWNRNDIIADNIFAYNIAMEIMQQNEDLEPKFVEEYRQRND